MSLIAALVWGVPHAAEACSCIGKPPPSVAAERADAVIEARVDGVEGVSGTPNARGADLLRYELSVARIFKGEVGASTTLVTRSSSAACGRSFVVGKRYLIYAYRTDDGDLADTMCSRTRLLSEADEDLAALGAGTVPSAPAVQGDTQSREPPRIEPAPLPAGPAPAAARGCSVGAPGPGLALGLVLAALVARRRRRPADT